MKNKSLIYLFGALVLLLVAYLIINSARDVTEKSESFVKADTTKIDALAIRNPTGSYKLKRSGTDWRVVDPVDFPADPRFVQDLVRRLGGVEVESVVSEDTAKYAQYQVGSTGADVTVLVGADTVAHLIIGKATDTRSHTYCRKVGDPKIYLVKGIFTGQLNRQVRDWRDKSIITLERDAVNRIDITLPQQSYSLVKVDSAHWNVLVGDLEKPASQQEIEHTVSAVTRMRCFDFVDGDSVKIVDFSKPAGAVTVNTTTGETFKIALLPQDAEQNRWLIKKEGVDNTLFLVYKATSSAFLKNPEDYWREADKAAATSPPPRPPMPKRPIPGTK